MNSAIDQILMSQETNRDYIKDNLRSALTPLTMDEITPIVFGASAFQYLNAACELKLFELLHEHNVLTKEDIMKHLSLEKRAVDILLLGTSSLRLTQKNNDQYYNSEAISSIMDKGHWKYFVDLVAFEQYICYEGQFKLTESLKTNSNAGLSLIEGGGRDLYHRLASRPDLKEHFYNYMHSWSKLSNPLLLETIDFTQVNTLMDVGGGTAVNAIDLVKKFPHLKVTVLEIESSAPVARDNIEKAGLTDSIDVKTCDIHHESFPQGYDCVLFSHQLVIWTEDENVNLLRKAFDAINDDGRVVIFSSISNDEGTGPLMAALDSVYFATVPAEGGMIYSWNDYETFLTKVGFNKINRYNCNAWTPHGVVEAFKR